jgi:alkylation response protein AidB-like acyl-CoA dehydrogenase
VPKPGADDGLIIQTVREFVRREVLPVASALERDDRYPDGLVATMGRLGLFGLNVPEAHGGIGAGHTTFVAVFEELARAWLGLSGILGTHLVLCDVLKSFGTSEQQERFLPVLARGETRGALCLSESEAGSDLQSIRTQATRDGDVYRINGSKMWITNARHAEVFLVLAKTDSDARPAHRGMSALVAEKGPPGLTVGRDIEKMGYRGLETCEVHFDNFPVPASNLVGGVEGQGFVQVMAGLEAERLNLAARALGLARAAFEDAVEYAQGRTAFGKPIAQHQAIQLKLADMATRIEATRLLTYSAAEKKDRGERCDLEVGMAKVFAADTAVEVSLEAMKIFGGNGYAKDFAIERYYRDAPLTLIGGGTGEVLRLMIARRLLEKFRSTDVPAPRGAPRA